MRFILVTGSSRGIGAAAAQALEQRGVTVIGHQSQPGDGDRIAADFTDPIAAQLLWEEALDRSGGRIDAVVNNAGLLAANPLNASDIAWLDGWEDTLRINLTAAAQLSRFAVRHWLAGRADDDGVRGRLVHVASRAAYRGDSPAHWHYAAAKGGMVAMHKTIARAYAGDGILSYAIAPGFTDTAMADDYLESRGGAGLLADIPLGRVAQPEEIARIIAFCALDAPPSMTGAVIDANGASYVR
ncbi:SDR family NAD(P)-dependent oxidoreductase [Erythrobacter sp. JK5]|uniref:SDR family NAD(P)-dependent oxidoreductase n=1 Tax=Erythrobacter sp. JK5 TaxID=2829500 RepID=UPI001BA99DFD|nr:SDR family oxidoreductase [Erythrobacter sp. JK5]QUL38544.1 SDR family oxidoreductase [Erythrobacter sp. JK5]